MNISLLKNLVIQKLHEFRHSLSYIDALPQLTLLGFIIGLFTGIIIVSFRLIIEFSLFALLPQGADNFEGLSLHLRIVMIATGIVILMILMLSVKAKYREIGVSHVIDRIHNHQSKLPFKNCCVQFFGALICMVSGQSVGREGPAVHLGACAASQFGQWLKLPNNSINTLVGCGAAAAIAASFDTPMAGVIFAMEVLTIEYTVVGFVPVILASVTGTALSKLVFGDSVFILVGDTNIASLYEVPFMVAIGIVISLCAGAYIKLNLFALKLASIPLVIRLTIAGVLTSLTVIFIPEVMGQGYDTVNAVVNDQILLTSLIVIGLAKLFLTPIVVGLGLPGGLIGPMLVAGACIGAALGHIIAELFPELGVNPSFYVMIGMSGMMAAAFNAPLAALVTVLELTYNPNIIFPSMLVIVIACVSTRRLFKIKGIFHEQLRHSNKTIDFGPAKQALRRAGVRSVMDTRFKVTSQKLSCSQAKAILHSRPMWLIVSDQDGRYCHAMHAADLANHLESCEDEESGNENDAKNIIDLDEIPSRNYLIGAIHESASLYEAMQGFNAHSTEVLYVSGQQTYYSEEVKGILTLSSIENYYKPVEFQNAVD
ncbi:chloride channel protein [Agarilytica rhodophyticola]|uniref:chloride channel protein n=1 Tax=Agarilytica rhodophyticola TaxID=1737490 RepID=UPI000B3441CE|nr:chloride channel protein [Agarilytica rhodophyticola]